MWLSLLLMLQATVLAGVGEPLATKEWMPSGHLYSPYLAGEREPRMAAAVVHDGHRLLGDAGLGARVGLLAVRDGRQRPRWQFDFDAAALARFDLSRAQIFEAVDFRAGLSLGRRLSDATVVRLAYSHLSAHLGDEFLLRTPGVARADYSRDAFIVGIMRNLSLGWQVYGELGYAFVARGGAEPWELQVGTQYDGLSRPDRAAAPFIAGHAGVRQEALDVPTVSLAAGWGWRPTAGRSFRLGLRGHLGRSLQYSFVTRRDWSIGLAVWLLD